MDQCTKMQELTIPYINQQLTKAEISKFISHLSICPTCRSEVGLFIQLSKELKEPLQEVPQEVLKSAFALFNDTDTKNLTVKLQLRELIRKKYLSPNLGIQIITCILSPMKDTIKLTLENN